MVETNQIYCADNVEFMKKNIPDNYIDLVVTSPPYNNIRLYNGYDFNFEETANELYRIIKPGGVVVWIVGDETINGSETGTSFEQALYFKKIKFNLHDTMIYQKANPPPVGGNNRYYQHFEYMFVFSKGKPKTFNPIKAERINKYNDKRTQRVKAFNRDKQGNFTKKLYVFQDVVKIGNVWNYVVGGGNSVEYGIKHPAVFPEKLASDHILSWSNPNDIILDLFCGSGTTCIAAKKANRQFIGIDVSQEYCDLSNKRIAEII